MRRGPADAIEQVIDDISTDFKNKQSSKKPVWKNKGTSKSESRDRFNAKYDAMLYMHRQMKNNMRGVMSQWFPQADWFMPPAMQDIKNSFTNMENMISEIQKMVPGVSDLMPDIPFMAKNMEQPVLTRIHEQRVQLLTQMSQMARDMNQFFTENMRQRDDKMFELIMKMFRPQSDDDEDEA